jgi:hypothetical protein
MADPALQQNSDGSLNMDTDGGVLLASDDDSCCCTEPCDATRLCGTSPFERTTCTGFPYFLNDVNITADLSMTGTHQFYERFSIGAYLSAEVTGSISLALTGQFITAVQQNTIPIVGPYLYIRGRNRTNHEFPANSFQGFDPAIMTSKSVSATWYSSAHGTSIPMGDLVMEDSEITIRIQPSGGNVQLIIDAAYWKTWKSDVITTMGYLNGEWRFSAGVRVRCSKTISGSTWTAMLASYCAGNPITLADDESLTISTTIGSLPYYPSYAAAGTDLDPDTDQFYRSPYDMMYYSRFGPQGAPSITSSSAVVTATIAPVATTTAHDATTILGQPLPRALDISGQLAIAWETPFAGVISTAGAFEYASFSATLQMPDVTTCMLYPAKWTGSATINVPAVTDYSTSGTATCDITLELGSDVFMQRNTPEYEQASDSFTSFNVQDLTLGLLTFTVTGTNPWPTGYKPLPYKLRFQTSGTFPSGGVTVVQPVHIIGMEDTGEHLGDNPALSPIYRRVFDDAAETLTITETTSTGSYHCDTSEEALMMMAPLMAMSAASEDSGTVGICFGQQLKWPVAVWEQFQNYPLIEGKYQVPRSMFESVKHLYADAD